MAPEGIIKLRLEQNGKLLDKNKETTATEIQQAG